LRKSKGLTQSALAEAIGIGSFSVSQYERGDNYPSFEKLIALKQFFGVSLDDLVYADLSEGQGQEVHEPGTTYGSRSRNYLVPAGAHAGYPIEWTQEYMEQNAAKVVAPGIEGDARTFEVVGDSMQPVLFAGDYAICRPVPNPHETASGAIHVIVTKSTGIHIKYVHLAPGYMITASENREYQPYRIELDDILEIWRVVMLLRPGVVNPRHFIDYRSVDDRLQDFYSFLDQEFPGWQKKVKK